MTLELRPEIADGLTALASARGLSVEDYLQDLVERERPAPPMPAKTVFEQGLGLFGSPEDAALLDQVVSLAYEERHKPSEPSSVL
jgi:hypothetical protein